MIPITKKNAKMVRNVLFFVALRESIGTCEFSGIYQKQAHKHALCKKSKTKSSCSENKN